MKVEKYNGCGNDFVMVPFDSNANYEKLAPFLCQLATFQTDGLIAVKENPLEMIFYNQDGSRAPMCGNGIRCFAKYCWDHQLVTTWNFPVKTLAGTLEIKILTLHPFTCEVAMGQPQYDKDLVGFTAADNLKNYEIPLTDKKVIATSLFMGTVHTVIFVEDVEKELTLSNGSDICHHPYFKRETNVNFVEILPDHTLKVRTFERGVGWTLACGTGCCASYVAARDLGLIPAEKTTVHLPLGELIISGEEEIFMSGPAVFEKEEEITC